MLIKKNCECLEIHSKSLLNTGSCGLHTLHNAFRSGCEASGWDLEDALGSLYYLFKDCPARRHDYISVSGSQEFPSKFCKCRWLENVSVMSRALEIMPNVSKFVESVNKKAINRPKTKSFASVQQTVNDRLFEVKGKVFISVGNEIEEFLRKYQTDAPVLPIMITDLYFLVRQLMKRFVKSGKMNYISSIDDLLRIDFENSENHKETSKIQIGFAASESLTSVRKKFKISDLDVFRFRSACLDFFMATTKKILEKSPVRYRLARNLVCLHPDLIKQDEEKIINHFTICLKELTSAGRLPSEKADLVIKEFTAFRIYLIENSVEFNASSDRLDSFYYRQLNTKDEYKRLWPVVKVLLCLSHGQSTVERGFSTNKYAVVENQTALNLTARRLIIDHIQKAGGVEKVNITKDLIISAGNARRHYRTYLETKVKEKTEEEKRMKRRASIDEMESKKQRLEKDIQALTKAGENCP